MILVIGATGNVGSKLVEQLTTMGYQVRALVRSPEKAARINERNQHMTQQNPSAASRAGSPVYDETCLVCRLTQKNKAPSERVACFVCRFKYRLKHLGLRRVS